MKFRENKIKKNIKYLIDTKNAETEEEFLHNLARAISLSMELENVSLALDIKMAYDCVKQSHPAPKRDMQAHLEDAQAHLFGITEQEKPKW